MPFSPGFPGSVAEGGGGGVTDHTLLTNIGVNTHVQIDTHLANLTKHRLINDAGTGATDLLSASKILAAIAACSVGRVLVIPPGTWAPPVNARCPIKAVAALIANPGFGNKDALQFDDTTPQGAISGLFWIPTGVANITFRLSIKAVSNPTPNDDIAFSIYHEQTGDEEDPPGFTTKDNILPYRFLNANTKEYTFEVTKTLVWMGMETEKWTQIELVRDSPDDLSGNLLLTGFELEWS